MKKKKNKSLFVSPAPHLSHRDSTTKIMWIVFISLLPAGAWGVYFFGLPALEVIVASIASCMLTELAFNLIRKNPITIGDGSAAVTGILLAFVLPPYVPVYVPITAGIFAIGIAKMLFGGLGYNVMNPALSGRVFVMFAWMGPMTASQYFMPIMEKSFYLGKAGEALSAISSATPLHLMKDLIGGGKVELPPAMDLAMGKVGGSIGEVSALFLVLGALWLFKRRYITWQIPVTFIATVAIITFLFGVSQGVVLNPSYGAFKNAVVFAYLHLLSGGLILGAFYMATDMVTTPLTKTGQLIVGVGTGILTALIRLYGGYPEGVMFAILLMELVVPLIDRYSRPNIYGWETKNER
jgi:electron transport complex protein RnfD